MTLSKNKLKEYISQAIEGDQMAFNDILNTYWNDVYLFLLKRTGSDYEAEDITIRSFSKAFDKLDSYKDNFVFKTWLLTIAKNIHIDLVRKKNASIRSKTTRGEDGNVLDIPDKTPSPEDKLITEQNLAQLLRYIKELKPHYQEVINLRYFQELSYKEIAEVLKEPINNIKVKLLRARRLLAEIIEKASS